jgi:hypothetical protein
MLVIMLHYGGGKIKVEAKEENFTSEVCFSAMVSYIVYHPLPKLSKRKSHFSCR